MRSSLTTAPAGRGDRASRPGRGGLGTGPGAVILSLVPPGPHSGPAAGMLRRSAAWLGHPRRPPQAVVPAHSRLVFRSGVVRAG
jgi:hypothetical protein